MRPHRGSPYNDASRPARQSRGTDVRNVALAVFRRNVHIAFTKPALLIPAVMFPMVFLLAFAGGLSAVDDIPGFDFPADYTAFQFVFVALQSAAFGGVFAGFSIAADFESGFARRLLLAAPRRTGIVLGYVGAGAVRFLATGTLITVAALASGMQVGGNGVELAGLLGLALMVNVAATLFAAGFSMRTKTMQAAPGMQIPVFLSLFLAPVYVPLDLLQGWIHSVASVNPVTALVTAGRGFIAGEPTGQLLAFGVAAGLVALFFVWAVRSLRRVEMGL
jgi:ABC-2 type transport system permease protein